MKISVLVLGSPTETRACHSALSFARAVIESKHELFRVFFYQDAVEICKSSFDESSEELQLQGKWQSFAEQSKVELDICISAAQRRGIGNSEPISNVANRFQIMGLGQLVEAMIESDRLVTFSE